MKRKSLHWLLPVLLTGLITGCRDQGEKAGMIKYASIEQVVVQSGLREQEQAHLMQVKAALDKGMALAQARYKELPQEKVVQASQADQQILQVQWQAEQNKAREAVQNVLLVESEKLRKEKNLQAIMPLHTALAVAPEMRLTEALAERLKKTKVTFGEVPEITLKAEAEPAIREKAVK
ncbi:hypothetical protein VRC02_07345 [Erwinia sp. E_sp_B01_3]|uniref:hypothetical protein n=1 Tax=unclassified Erwinia TaxID=2622719 RepID=UPI0030CE9F0C